MNTDRSTAVSNHRPCFAPNFVAMLRDKILSKEEEVRQLFALSLFTFRRSFLAISSPKKHRSMLDKANVTNSDVLIYVN